MSPQQDQSPPPDDAERFPQDARAGEEAPLNKVEELVRRAREGDELERTADVPEAQDSPAGFRGARGGGDRGTT